MASERYDIVVVGGGSAGLVAAVGAAKLGARVALVERKSLGGDCLYTGCVPSKALIASARFARETRRAAEFGFAPLDWRFKGDDFASITGRVARVVASVAERDAPEVFRAEGVEIVFGTPRFVSPHELEVVPRAPGAAGEGGGESFPSDGGGAGGGGRILRARRFCISTGSSPAVPEVAGLGEAGFLTNEEVFGLKSLPRSLVVLGGGPVGLELGQSFARLGSRVTVVEMGGRLLPKEDEEVSAAVEGFMREDGLEILLGAKATAARRAGDGGRVVSFEQEGRAREVRAEEILVATGRRANVGGLNLEAAGVRFDARRVFTDDYLRTTARHVFAAGDVTGHFPFTHMAAYEGALVVRNALFFWPLTRRADFRVVPWATFTDPEVGRVGLTEREARERFGAARVRVYRAAFAENDRAQAEGDGRGFAKLVCAGRRDALVGAHLVGPRAGELIHELVLAMRYKLPASAVGGLTHVYPTLSQVSQRAGLDAALAKLAPFKKLLARYFTLLR